MVLSIDVSQSLRRPADLAALVEAIHDATPNDETDWIEWKGRWDLTSTAGQFHLARHILGMANRPPMAAALHAGGCGYIVFGAEPGSIDGVTAVDPADLDSATRPYMPVASPPVWSAYYVHRDGASVLVVVVEPPRQGDPIHALHREYDRYRAGTIFVRRPGRTIAAEPADIAALSERLVAHQDVPLTLSVATVDGGALTLQALSSEASLCNKQLEAHRVEVDFAQSNVFAGDDKPDVTTVLRSLKPDPTFPQRLNAYIERLRAHYIDVATLRYVTGDYARLRLQVVNGSERNYADVQVTVKLPGQLKAADPKEEEPTVGEEPKPPHRGFAGIETMSAGYAASQRALLGLPKRLVPKPYTINGGVIEYDVGHVRPLRPAVLPVLLALVHAQPAGELIAEWQITASNVDTVERGTLPLHVIEPVTVDELLGYRAPE